MDAVVLDEQARVVEATADLSADGLAVLLRRWRPEAVAIDSPPGPGLEPGASTRSCERELRSLGVNVFSTPSNPTRFSHRFYDWVRVGAEAFDAAARSGYARQDEPGGVQGRALEVFPHASEVFLRGSLPPPRTTRRVGTKRAWRLSTLHDQGVDTSPLRRNRLGRPTLDSIDAALAALTARAALLGDYTALGVTGEWLIAPGHRELPFERSPTPTRPR